MLCTHKTASSASLVLEICPQFNNSFLHQFSSNFGGNCIRFKTNVDEKSVKGGGTQLITTLDGYAVPLLIKDSLAYATSLGRPTDQDMDTYPHVIFTSPDEWDPSVLDHDPPHLDRLDPIQVPDQPFSDPMFDAYGDFNESIIANINTLSDNIRKWGAMDTLISDGGKYEISK